MIEKGKVIVVKIGGSTLGEHDTTLEDLVILQRKKVPLVVVHGGGNKITNWLSRQGTPTNFVRGLRVTDEKVLEVVTAILGGLVNKELVASINLLGGKALGLTGVDGNLVEGKIEQVELGYVGTITGINLEPLETILNAGFIPIVAPPCAKAASETAEVPFLNINGDEIAGELAAALNAEKLIFLTDVEGICNQEGNLLSELTPERINSLIDSGVISGGMLPKVKAALRALPYTSSVQIIDGRLPHALLKAVEGKAKGTQLKSSSS